VPSKHLLLLTDPANFEVTYTINPWMEPYAWAENPVGHRTAARRSFQSLAATLTAAGARLEIMPGVAGLPDMVFPANAAVVLDRLALLGRFRHPERRGEEKHFQEHFRVLMERGFILDEVAQIPSNCFQEGAGDCIWDAARGRLATVLSSRRLLLPVERRRDLLLSAGVFRGITWQDPRSRSA